MIKTNKKSEKISSKELTANEFTDVRDIKNDMLYSKSPYIFGYLKIDPINIDLLSDDEKENLCEILTGSFKDEKLKFGIISIPRTVDMERYLEHLSNNYDQEVTNPIRKTLLSDMISQGTKMIMDGQNFEHQFYLKIWADYDSNIVGIENKLKERLIDFQTRYSSIGNNTELLDDVGIIKLCNLFSNSNTAVFEDYSDTNYVPIPFIKRQVEE